MGCGATKYSQGAPPRPNGDIYFPKKDKDEQAELVELIDKVKNATDILSPDLTEDIHRIKEITYKPPGEQNQLALLAAAENGLIAFSFKIVKQLYSKDFLEPSNNHVFDILSHFMGFLECSPYWSEDACKTLMEIKAHQYILDLVLDPKLEVSEIDNGTESYDKRVLLMRLIIGLIYNMVRVKETEARQVFRELGAVQTLQKKLESSKSPPIQATAIVTLGYLINEDENDLVNVDDTHIEFLAQLMTAVMEVDGRFAYGTSAMNMVEGFNKLAVNDKNKNRLNKYGVLKHYETLLKEAELDEHKILICQGIWTLAFDQSCRHSINSMPDLYSGLKDLSSHSNEQLRNAANGALWTLQGDDQSKKKKKKKKANTTGSEEVANKNVHHIMISYNWGVKPLVLTIRDRLVSAGFKVWMDVDNMTGSTLEAMAEAVEQASVVLICMTQKYKESPSCRTEAEYTYQLRKDFIPLRLEAGYKADGWLGIMTGTKLWFDFIKNFEAAFDGLDKELGNRGKLGGSATETVVQEISVSGSTQATSQTKAAHLSWSVTDVQNWFNKNGLGHQAKRVSTIDGVLLDEMKTMFTQAPEFFYSYFAGSNMKFAFCDLLLLTKALSKL